MYVYSHRNTFAPQSSKDVLTGSAIANRRASVCTVCQVSSHLVLASMQNLVLVFHTVCASSKNFEDAETWPLGRRVWGWPLETCCCPPVSPLPNFITLCQVSEWIPCGWDPARDSGLTRRPAVGPTAAAGCSRRAAAALAVASSAYAPAAFLAEAVASASLHSTQPTV